MLKPKNNKISTIFDKESNLEWKDDFYFIVGADTQYGQFERLGLVDRNKLPEGKKAWYKELELSEKAVSLVNQLEPKPKFMVICGDMLDAFYYKLVPGSSDRVFTDQLDSERDKQYEDFLRVFGKLNIPLVCVCGNHDVGDAPEKKLLDGYRKQFGDDYFAFYLDGVLFICLNSMYYFQSQFCEEEAKKQDEWLDEILLTEAKRFQHVLVFVHMPPFVMHIDEPNTFLNMDKYKRKILVHKLRNAGVKKIFAGHLHQNRLAYFTKDVEIVITSAIGMQNGPASNSGFRAVKVTRDEIHHQYYTFNDCPRAVEQFLREET